MPSDAPDYAAAARRPTTDADIVVVVLTLHAEADRRAMAAPSAIGRKVHQRDAQRGDAPQKLSQEMSGWGPLRAKKSGGTAQPRLSRISGSRKSVVAVTGRRRVLLNVRYAPIATKFGSAPK